MKLDEKGRCCGRKPIVYKRKSVLFCPRCDRVYSIFTKEQRENYFYKFVNGDFVKVRNI